MRRKRLQHVADTLCHMFCGWRLLFSFAKLERIGSGTLEIDVLERTCRFEGEEIERLTIADELHAWMTGDLAAHDMATSDLREAQSERE